MKYNFDEIINRRGTNSYKWDTTAPGVDAMWVADMDFRTAPCITEALRRRVEQGIFGYTFVPDEYYRATVGWFSRRHRWTIDPTHIIYTSGVVPAVSAIIKGMTRPGDKVIVQTPAYNCFFSSIRNNGCQLSANRLRYENGVYSIDFEDLERRAADPEAKVLLLCNPHNPSGRVWTRAELERVADIAMRNGLFVISDEIHCELTYEGHDYTPFASLGEDIARRCAVCVSPSKAFNIAGLQIANIIAADSEVRRKIDRAINDNEVCDVNPFGVIATIEAYTNGEEWLDALRKYLWGNYVVLRDFFHRELPSYPVTDLEGTYLAWIDCSAAEIGADKLERLLEKEAKVRLNAGTMYGDGGEDFLRINLACPRELIEKALPRIARVLKNQEAVKNA
ncbi:MAG: pyridoxal phosphate-dependent aminotransferase [Muribaculaceae bacterium]|nr:pyridoxal phosphate-dependent aminotransferase [Muribaculaceae bacterium]